MKKIFVVIFLLILFVDAFAQSYITEDMKNDIMTVDKIKPGMEGYGLTVFHDVTIEKFNFKVIGVIKEANRGQDLIYVELDHPRINRSNSSVIQGMSGSPCYIDGKLVGAVSMGWGFAKENVCMLTPIMDMFETWDPNIDRDIEATNKISSKNQMFIPISVSGLTPATEALISEDFKSKGYYVYAGAGGEGDAVNMPGYEKAALEPGAAVSAVLIDGDIRAVGTGTVTYKKGNKILAFGHPMDELGVTDIPMAKSYILDIFSSFEVSRKISNPLDVVGAVYLDRSFAIAGEIGRVAAMSPVHVHIKDVSTGREQNLHCSVPTKPIYFNNFAPLVVIEGINRCRVGSCPTYGEFTYSLELLDGSKFTFSNCYTGQEKIDSDVIAELFQLLEKLNNSKYGVQKVKSVDVEGKIWDGNKSAYIERVFIDKNIFKPGDEVTVGVVMRKYAAKDTYTEYRKVKIPEDAEPGKLAILVYGGILSNAIETAEKEASSNKVLEIFGKKDNTVSFNQYLDKYLEFEKNNELVVSLVQDKGSTLVANGEELKNLPEYMKMMFSNTNNSVISEMPIEYKTVFKTDIVPIGLATITIPMENENKNTVLDNNGKPLINVQTKVLNLKENNFNLKDKKLSVNILQMIDELDEAISVTEKDVKDNNIPSILEPEKEENKKEDTKEKDKKVDNQVKIKSSIKKPLLLTYEEPKDFNNGKFTNCNIGKDSIFSTVEFEKVISAKDQLATCGLNTSQGMFVGFGLNSGVALIKEGKLSETIPLDGLWVSAICEVGENVYAVSNPGSFVYKIKSGNVLTAEKLSFNPNHKYISKMIAFGDNILMGFSDSDEILLLDKNFKILKKINHKSVFTTDFAKYGDMIYVGTKDKIISLDKDLNVNTVVNNPGGVITTLSVNSKGDIYAFIATKNIIIKKDDSGIEKIISKSSEMFASFIDESDTVFFVGREVIAKIYPNGNYVADKYTDFAAQFSDIIPCDKDKVFITSTNPGKIFTVNLHPKECIYTSANIDLGEEATLKSIEVPITDCEILVGADLENAKPYKEVKTVKDFKIFVKFNEKQTGKFNKITVKYFMNNRTPKVEIKELSVNDVIKGKKKIDFIVNDPDNDSYSVKIFAQALGQDYKQIYPNEKSKEEKDKDPIKSYEIDTKELKDGVYNFKVTADDFLSNPENGKVGECEIKYVTVKNNPPTVSVDNKEIKVKEGEEIIVCGKVVGKDIIGVEYSLGEAYRQVILFNNNEFKINLGELKKGTYTLFVRGVDEEENHSEVSVNITVE